MKKIKRLKIPFEALKTRNQKIIKKTLGGRSKRTGLAIGSGGILTATNRFVGELCGASNEVIILFVVFGGTGGFVFSRLARPNRTVKRTTEIIGRAIRGETFLKPEFREKYDMQELKKTYTHAIIDRKGNLILVREPEKGFFRKAFRTALKPFRRKRVAITQKVMVRRRGRKK